MKALQQLEELEHAKRQFAIHRMFTSYWRIEAEVSQGDDVINAKKAMLVHLDAMCEVQKQIYTLLR
jgi:hypothetical protein